MDIQRQDELLRKLANGGIPDSEIFPTPNIWPQLLEGLIERVQEIVATFPVPNLGAPPPRWHNQRLLSPTASSPADANKENTDPAPQPPKDGEPKALPPQIQDMLDEVLRTLRTFPANPPHTVQRIAELILEPKRHYRAMASYLHALDRVVHVTSPSTRYPLSTAPEPSAVNGVSWGNTAQVVGTDEALGGALLTPIPWLAEQKRAEVRTESTERIEGPNGVGSIETVSISVNGISSMTSSSMSMRPVQRLEEEDTGEESEEEEHARGPEEIDAKDLGPGVEATNMKREEVQGLQPREIDLEVAVGRKPDGEGQEVVMEDVEAGSKRGAEGKLEESQAKKPRSEDGEAEKEEEGEGKGGS